MLFLAVVLTLFLITNSAKRILSFRSTANQVLGEEARLERLRQENEDLKRELEYKKSQRFVEEELRNKLGLAREGEEVYVIGEQEGDNGQETVEVKQLPNWKKWQKLIFGEG